MSTISSLGVGSGLDIESIISGLMAVEQQPLDRLQSKATTLSAQISAYGTFKSAVSTFQTAMEDLSTLSSFKIFSASSSDETVLTGSADSTAAAGSYDVTVTTLAANDKYASSAITDSSTTVGEGTLTIAVGSSSFDVTIDSTNSTLAGIKNAINNATDNTGVTASIITDDSGAHLVLSSDETGTANALTVSVTGDSDGNDTDASGLSSFINANMTSLSTATDSVVSIDGYTVTSSSNTITDAIEGVTINALTEGTSTLTISRDDSAILDSVNSFVDAFNALRTQINTQLNGQLEADSALTSIERQIFGVLNSGSSITGSSFSYLSEVGITLDKDGVMSVDEDTVSSILSSDFSSFTNLFAADGEGIANRLNTLAEGWLQTDGLIDARQSGLQDRLDDNQVQQDMWDNRLTIIEDRLRAKFTAMDTLVSTLNSNGDYLLSQLSSLSSSN